MVSGSLVPVSTLTSSGVIYYQDDEGSEKIAKDRPVRAWRVCAEGHVGSSGRASGFVGSKLETHPCFLPFLHLVEYLRVSLDRRFCALIDLWVVARPRGHGREATTLQSLNYKPACLPQSQWQTFDARPAAFCRVSSFFLYSSPGFLKPLKRETHKLDRQKLDPQTVIRGMTCVSGVIQAHTGFQIGVHGVMI